MDMIVLVSADSPGVHEVTAYASMIGYSKNRNFFVTGTLAEARVVTERWKRTQQACDR